MNQNICDKFIQALNSVESNGEIEQMKNLFTEDCTIWNVQMATPLKGTDGVQKFWDVYKKTFRDIHSEFTHREETENCIVLEWKSEGKLPHDEPIKYSGATILEHDGERIKSFRSYFDSKAVIRHLH